MTITIEWSPEKSLALKASRNICFEDIESAIIAGKLIDILPHHNSEKYPNQKIFIVEVNGYVCYVPFVESKNKIFLKTIIPSRKYNKKLKNHVKK